MSLYNANKLNQLLQGAQDGKLYFSSWLKVNGYSDQFVKQYRTSGWLITLSKRVMYRTGSKITSWGLYLAIMKSQAKHFMLQLTQLWNCLGLNKKSFELDYEIENRYEKKRLCYNSNINDEKISCGVLNVQSGNKNYEFTLKETL